MASKNKPKTPATPEAKRRLITLALAGTLIGVPLVASGIQTYRLWKVNRELRETEKSTRTLKQEREKLQRELNRLQKRGKKGGEKINIDPDRYEKWLQKGKEVSATQCFVASNPRFSTHAANVAGRTPLQFKFGRKQAAWRVRRTRRA